LENNITNQKDINKDNDIYFYRELLTYSKEKRRIDLVTISSYDNITSLRESKLQNCFPDNRKRAKT
jgi:hypothetical protein